MEEELKTAGEDLADGSQEETATPGTLHSNPNWLSDMRLAFKVSSSVFKLKNITFIFVGVCGGEVR